MKRISPWHDDDKIWELAQSWKRWIDNKFVNCFVPEIILREIVKQFSKSYLLRLKENSITRFKLQIIFPYIELNPLEENTFFLSCVEEEILLRG